MGRQSKKLQMQGAQTLRNEAYIEVRCNKPAPAKAGAGYSAIPRNAGQMDFLRSRHPLIIHS